MFEPKCELYCWFAYMFCLPPLFVLFTHSTWLIVMLLSQIQFAFVSSVLTCICWPNNCVSIYCMPLVTQRPLPHGSCKKTSVSCEQSCTSPGHLKNSWTIFVTGSNQNCYFTYSFTTPNQWFTFIGLVILITMELLLVFNF